MKCKDNAQSKHAKFYKMKLEDRSKGFFSYK